MGGHGSPSVWPRAGELEGGRQIGTTNLSGAVAFRRGLGEWVGTERCSNCPLPERSRLRARLINIPKLCEIGERTRLGG